VTTLAAAAPTRIRWAAVAAWMGVIFWLSSRPALPRTPAADYQSVLGHVGAYAILATLVAWALRPRGRTLTVTLATAWLVAVLYGVTDEIHRSFVPNRYPDVRDVVTDAIGAAIALVAVAWWTRGSRSGRPPRSVPATKSTSVP
jgi:VanZ family protein